MKRISILGVAALAGCPSVERDPPPTGSSAIIAVFSPNAAAPCESDLPFPTDLAKDPMTGRLNVPYCMTDSPSSTALKTGLRTLDGYAQSVSITVKFTGELDPASFAGAIHLLSPTGERVPVGTQFLAARNLLVIQPLAPLAEKTRYLVVLDDGLKGKDGRKVVADRALTLAKSTTPLVDAKGYSTVAALDGATANGLEGLRRGFAAAFDAAVAATGKTRAQIVMLYPFTTQTGYSAMTALAQLVEAKGGARVVHDTQIRAADHALVRAAGIPVSDVCAIHSGHVQLAGLLTPAGRFGADAMGRPLTSTVSVDYLLTTPKLGGACAMVEPWNNRKVVVFAHALGRCKNDVLALANNFAKAGYATLAIDGVRAGARTENSLGDQNLDGCPDSAATPELILRGRESLDPFGLRDRMRGWALDLAQIAKKAKAAPWEFAGQTRPAMAVSTRVVMGGHSWGSMATLLAAPLAGADAVAVNAAAGDLGSVFAPLVAAGVQATLPMGTTPAQAEAAAAEAVGIFRWAMEPGDALFAAKAYANGPPLLMQIVTAGNAEAALHERANQERIAGAYMAAGAEVRNFELAADATSATFCADATASVGALLRPCSARTADVATQQRALGAYAGLQRQYVTFLATATSTGAVICDSNITVACP